MPRARNRYQRAVQVLRWCQANWPTNRPIDLRWEPEVLDDDGEQCDAESGRDGRRMFIVLSERRNRTWRETADSVIHEYAHVMQWPVAGPAETTLDDHPAAFGAQYWEIKDNFDHRGGYADACEYPTE